uniref:Penicillin-binding protein activator n=1 Tax=Candidatus Kentrum eta TaxID=2126337 RepID=A0A450VED7_9GAMM|nr:MAG: hypothetical protein BECKH772B_GA0070898_103271 [Candidatus Kentron sp. H]VFK03591.1 MAG: hypothetical protein BECKH772C_GA0070978_101367 [Candidatus Kentron sp. H]VFK03853.1 MAG: hypothetical protein BECKH772A_GA0070896_103591 [Candidatus Kentron sp. H]
MLMKSKIPDFCPARWGLIMLQGKMILYVLLGLVIGGCGIIPDSSLSLIGDHEQTARKLMADGRFREAAEEYLRMASRTFPTRAYDYLLAAMGSYLDAGDPDAAETLLAKIDTARWTADQAAYGYLLMARIAVTKQRPEKAFVSLKKIYASDCNRDEIHVPSHLPSHCGPVLPEALWPDFFRTRALAYAALGGNNAFQAVRDRIALDMLLMEAPEIEPNHRAIWSLLSSLSPAFLAHAYIWSPTSRAPLPLRVKTLQGWLTLAGIIKQRTSGKTSPYAQTLSQALASWQKRHPGHPAGRFLLQELVAIVQAQPPAHIALLLPLDGDFSGAAKAIRNGFLSAWLQEDKSSENGKDNRPVITIHNTVGADIPTLYNEVVSAGAEFVVGPLDKPSVALLARLPALSRPTLTLNHVAETPDNGSRTKTIAESDAPLYQFALGPESEAEQVAQRAWRDGHIQAAILTPKTPWGQRMAQAFATTWERLSGAVVDSQRFPDTLEEISISVQKLLANTGHRESDPKHHGIDCILMAAFPREARQLRPQLKFHYAGKVPIYATSHVFSGTVNPVSDQDTNEVIFGDMPWVLQNLEDETALRNVVTATWPKFAPRYLRYYALGIDTYRIIPHLEGLRTGNFESFEGETGELSVDSEGRVNRKLLWARIHQGEPVIFR